MNGNSVRNFSLLLFVSSIAYYVYVYNTSYYWDAAVEKMNVYSDKLEITSQKYYYLKVYSDRGHVSMSVLQFLILLNPTQMLHSIELLLFYLIFLIIFVFYWTSGLATLLLIKSTCIEYCPIEDIVVMIQLIISAFFSLMFFVLIILICLTIIDFKTNSENEKRNKKFFSQ